MRVINVGNQPSMGIRRQQSEPQTQVSFGKCLPKGSFIDAEKALAELKAKLTIVGGCSPKFIAKR